MRFKIIILIFLLSIFKTYSMEIDEKEVQENALPIPNQIESGSQNLIETEQKQDNKLNSFYYFAELDPEIITLIILQFCYTIIRDSSSWNFHENVLCELNNLCKVSKDLRAIIMSQRKLFIKLIKVFAKTHFAPKESKFSQESLDLQKKHMESTQYELNSKFQPTNLEEAHANLELIAKYIIAGINPNLRIMSFRDPGSSISLLRFIYDFWYFQNLAYLSKLSSLLIFFGANYEDCIYYCRYGKCNHRDCKYDGLKIATINGNLFEVLVWLNAKINLTDKNLGDALIFASSKGFKKIVKILIGAGTNVNYTFMGRSTPLMNASRNGHIKLELIRKLNK